MQSSPGSWIHSWPTRVPEPLEHVHSYCKLQLISEMRPLQPQPV